MGANIDQVLVGYELPGEAACMGGLSISGGFLFCGQQNWEFLVQGVVGGMGICTPHPEPSFAFCCKQTLVLTQV